MRADRPVGRTAYAAIGALTALAFVLAFHELAEKSLVLDEASSLAWAREGAAGLWDVVSGRDPNGGVYYLLLNGWVRVFGDGEGAARALGAVAAGLSVPALAVLGARLFGWATGLVAALLLAVDAFFIEWAQTARFYSLVVLLVVLSTYFFVGELERPSRWGWVGYVLASSLAVYSHYFAAYVLFVQLLTLLVLRRRAALTRRWLGAGIAIAALCAPEVVFAIRKGTGGISWIADPRFHDVLHLPTALAGESRPLAACLLVLVAYAVLRRRAADEPWRTDFVAAWLVIPVALAFVASFLQPMFLPKYLIVSLPALLLLAAAGIVRLPGRLVGAAVVVGLLVLSAGRLSAWYDSPSREDYRAAAGYITQAMRPGDAIAYHPSWVDYPVAYYFKRRGMAGPDEIGLGDATARSGRVWLVTRGYDVDARDQGRLVARFAGADRRVLALPHFRQVGVVLFSPANR